MIQRGKDPITQKHIKTNRKTGKQKQVAFIPFARFQKENETIIQEYEIRIAGTLFKGNHKRLEICGRKSGRSQ